MKRLIGRLGRNWHLFTLSKLFGTRKVKGRLGKALFTRMWYNVWLKEGYAKPEEDVIKKYRQYDSWSVDCILFFLGLLPIGTVRFIIAPDASFLPVVKDFKVTRLWDEKRVMEVTLLTIVSGFRIPYGIPFFVLMREVYRFAKEKGIGGVVIAADLRLFRLLRRVDLPFHKIGERKIYEGSMTQPAYMGFDEAEKVMRDSNHQLYKFFKG